MNKYKIDCHFEYDRFERPFGVFVKQWWRWKHICSFETDQKAQEYVIKILELPRIIEKLIR